MKKNIEVGTNVLDDFAEVFVEFRSAAENDDRVSVLRLVSSCWSNEDGEAISPLIVQVSELLNNWRNLFRRP